MRYRPLKRMRSMYPDLGDATLAGIFFKEGGESMLLRKPEPPKGPAKPPKK